MSHSLRDSQRSKIYAWENREFNAAGTKWCSDEPQMTIAEIKKLVTVVAREYGLTPRKVRVLDGRARRSACYSSGERAIKMPRWSRRRYIVLHELAHWIEWVLCPVMDTAAHGREFTGIYMVLLCRYHACKWDDLVKSANDARLDFVSERQSSPRYLKARGLDNTARQWAAKQR